MHYAQDDPPSVAPGKAASAPITRSRVSLSHAKGVFDQSRWNASNLLRAPFGRAADTILRLMLR
jgi:coniferyl-aldehyde dehydrogenase